TPGIIPQFKNKEEEQLFKKGVISMFKALFKDGFLDESERITMGALDATTEFYGYINVYAIYLFVARDRFRKMILSQCKNPLLADFKEQYDEKLRTAEQMNKFSPSINKWDAFVEPLMRTAMYHKKAIDWREAMGRALSAEEREIIAEKEGIPYEETPTTTHGKIIIVRLPKGEIGEELSKLAGAIIVLNIKIAALGRKENDPKFHVFLDECQNFLGSVDFETFASELRKYNVPLFLGTQYLDNFPSLSALFGNFPNIISYRVSGTDAKILEENYLD